MTDTLTPAFIEMARDGVPRDLTLAERGRRHLIVTGKSARLLHRGDVVALRDLTDDDETGTALVQTAFPGCTDEHVDMMRVITDRGVFLVPANRLVLVQTIGLSRVRRESV